MDTIAHMQAAADLIEDAVFTPEGQVKALSKDTRDDCFTLARTLVRICEKLMNTVEVDLLETVRIQDRAYYVLETLKSR